MPHKVAVPPRRRHLSLLGSQPQRPHLAPAPPARLARGAPARVLVGGLARKPELEGGEEELGGLEVGQDRVSEEEGLSE